MRGKGEREREKYTTQLRLGSAPQPKRPLQRECIHDPSQCPGSEGAYRNGVDLL